MCIEQDQKKKYRKHMATWKKKDKKKIMFLRLKILKKKCIWMPNMDFLHRKPYLHVPNLSIVVSDIWFFLMKIGFPFFSKYKKIKYKIK